MKGIKQRIEHLRKQPEPVRMRAVTLLTAGSGALLIVLWLTVLLPLQIRLNSPHDPAAENQTALSPTVSPTVSPAASQLAAPLPAGRQGDPSLQVPGVAGLRTASPVSQSPVATLSPSPSASPEASEDALLGLPTSSVEP